jgi:hypothetical protein
MNERIKELALQAGHPGFPRGEIELQKFAELIIKEYEQFLPEYCPWSNADESGPMKGWHAAFVARKHFGVK